MKGLIVKDFNLVKSIIITFFVISLCADLIVILYSFLIDASSTMFMLLSFYIMFFSGFILANTFAYEEKYKWELFADTLPYSRSKAVSARYTLGASCIGMFFLLTAVTKLIIDINLGNFNIENYLSNLTAMLVVGILPTSILLPLHYKLDANKARIVGTIVTVFVCGVAGGVLGFLTGYEGETIIQFPAYYSIIIIAACVVVFLLSWLLSVHIYKKREF